MTQIKDEKVLSLNKLARASARVSKYTTKKCVTKILYFQALYLLHI